MRIAAQEIPALENKRIISLDIASMVAGTTYRGQFEERIKTVIKELHDHPEIILFIDEIHTLMGAGNAQGSLDAANILKPALVLRPSTNTAPALRKTAHWNAASRK